MLRRLQIIAVAAILVVAAFSTGADFLFFLLYLAILVVGGSYVLTRLGLSDLEAGFTLDRVQAQVGDVMRATYTVRNTSRLPKLWLEISNPSALPVPLPGRAVTLESRAERTWSARVPLLRRGHFRVDPMLIRTGDPFGFFEASASVGTGATVIVYPRLESLPGWRLPAAFMEGSQARPERTLQSTPLVTSVRPYVTGDAFNRIHWKSSARQQELQVKEFDLEQTADVWVFLDLHRTVHAGEGDFSTLEMGVRAAASIAAKALLENRTVGLTASGKRSTVLSADRGGRQHQKVMHLLAAVEADGNDPFVEVLVQGLPRLRRGMTAVAITPSTDRDWVRPLSALRGRGVAPVVCLLDAVGFEQATRAAVGEAPLSTVDADDRMRAGRAIRHALAEFDLTVFEVLPDRSLGESLASVEVATRAGRL